MGLKMLIVPATMLLLIPSSFAAEAFGIEETFPKQTFMLTAVAANIEKNMATEVKQCFTDGGTTVQDALEATAVNLGSHARALLVKPKLPSEPKAAWGCFCGAYTCPMWIYSFKSGKVRSVWSSVGVSVMILDRKSRGYRHIFLSSGSAGHQEAILYAWNGHEYKIMMEKSVVFGHGNDEDERAENEMAKFRDDAIR